MMRTLPLLVCVLAVGCTNGISDDVQLTALADAEVMDLCEESQAISFIPTDEQACTLGAAASTPDEASCMAARDACLMMPPAETTDCTTAAASELASCGSATVGDMRACLNAQASAFASLFMLADCALAGTEGAPSLDGLLMQPAECDAIAPCFGS